MDKQAYEYAIGMVLNKRAAISQFGLEPPKVDREEQRRRGHRQIDDADTKLGPIGEYWLKDQLHDGLDRYIDNRHDIQKDKDLAATLMDVASEHNADDSIRRSLAERGMSYAASGIGGGVLGAAVAGEGNRLTGFGVGTATGLLLNLLRRKLYYGDVVKW